MPWLNPAFGQQRESPTLVVLTTTLQLGLIALVWLLALVPAALAALAMLIVAAVGRALGVRGERPPNDAGR